MSTNALSHTIVYPESDGLPIAENTVQYQWITKLVGGLELTFRDAPNVFVAGDLFWYPVEGNNTVVVAPDAMVAIGRPKGDRGSYRQWEEGGIAPQAVFEVLSPSNNRDEMRKKLAFYEKYGVEEYYVIDPDEESVEGWRRDGGFLVSVGDLDEWVSPRLGIRFETRNSTLAVIGPDGRPFENYLEIGGRAEQSERAARESARTAALERRRAETERRRAETERRRAETEHQRAQMERLRAEEAERAAKSERQRAEEADLRVKRLAEKLRALGLDPEA